MSRHAPSNIRVSVQFSKSTVFAGEDVECVITFKNTAREPGERSPTRSPHNGTPPVDRSRKVTPTQNSAKPPPVSRNSSYGPNIPAHMKKGHRATHSVGTLSRQGSAAEEGKLAENNAPEPGRQKHGRSLSIISMGADGTTGNGEQGRNVSEGTWKATRSAAHGRTSSLQTVPRRGSKGSASPFVGPSSPAQSSAQPSPRIGFTSSPVNTDFSTNTRPSRPTSSRAATTGLRPAPRVSPGTLQQNFKFPPPRPEVTVHPAGAPDSAVSPKTDSLPFRNSSSQPPDSETNQNPIARLIAESSANGTSRSSLDLYSMSNHSDETLASEYVPQPTSRFLLPRMGHVRNNSRLGPREAHRGPETIMMGYAQVMGSFTLDGSLVNQAPFEEVKRKGVVGGYGGGGVVGVERTKRESGLFGSLGWSNIGESLGGLLGTGELSSIKEMRGIAGSKSVPLVTTPHSILFVDLRLAPGESKSYSYTFALPRGLPPSHKGRAMKVSYHLTIGTQRAGSEKDQQIRSIDVPFRVFGSVTPRGEILGHDLMSPYILLRDLAKTSTISSPSARPKKPPDMKAGSDFMQYIDILLEEQKNGQSGLLSPTSPLSPAAAGNNRRHSSVAEEPRTMKEAIDLTILRSNHTLNAKTSLSNKFDISRSGLRVATLHLPRPSYRLGETIHLVIAFKGAAIPTYAVQVALETAERVDSAISMRSSASLYRYTRKVHAYAAENSLFSQRLAFSLLIPTNATPEFITSGVSLEWRIRVEFVTPRVTKGKATEEGDSGDEEQFDDLLEEVSRDDRGVMLQGVEGLKVETFEVGVPVRVFGAVVGGKGEWDVDGLAV